MQLFIIEVEFQIIKRHWLTKNCQYRHCDDECPASESVHTFTRFFYFVFPNKNHILFRLNGNHWRSSILVDCLIVNRFIFSRYSIENIDLNSITAPIPVCIWIHCIRSNHFNMYQWVKYCIVMFPLVEFHSRFPLVLWL